MLADVAVPTVLAASGAVTAMADTVPGPWWGQTAITVGAILVSVRLITLPGAIVSRRMIITRPRPKKTPAAAAKRSVLILTRGSGSRA